MPAAQQDPKKTLKIALAIGLFVVAGLVYAYTSGLFDGGAKLPPKEEQAAAAEKQAQREESIKKSGAVQSGAN